MKVKTKHTILKFLGLHNGANCYKNGCEEFCGTGYEKLNFIDYKWLDERCLGSKLIDKGNKKDKGVVGENMKKKFILEFDEEPAFVFVSKNGFDDEKIYKNGVEVKDWRSLNVFSSMDEFTTHQIEYVTVKSSKKKD